MQTQSQSTPPTNNDPMTAEQWRRLIDNVIKTLDPELPSVVIDPGPVGVIGEPSGAYLEREKTEFVKADDKGWA